jgi:hypothetical protein
VMAYRPVHKQPTLGVYGGQENEWNRLLRGRTDPG